VKSITQFLRGHAGYVLRTGHPANGVGNHGGTLAKKRAEDKELRSDKRMRNARVRSGTVLI
jgi:hypothetical protein